MASLEDLEQRVIELEARLHMESGLAANRDRDVSDMQVTLSSHTRMLESVQRTLGQHGAALANLERELGSVRLEMQTVRLETQTGFALIGGQLAQLLERGGEPGEASS